MSELKPCKHCGNKAHLATRYQDDLFCAVCTTCGISTRWESKENAIFDWNRRVEPENKPLTPEELRQMDGDTAYIQFGDSTEGNAVLQWEDDSLYLYGPDFGDRYEPDLDFYGMFYDDPDGYFGLHLLGWLAYRQKPVSKK